MNGDWQLRKKDADQSIDAKVSGCVHTDLMAAGEIEDQFYRDNKKKVMWIGENDWVYSRTFEADNELLNNKRIIIQFDGLDTLAEIKINDEKLATTDNMFRTYEFDIKHLLQPGTNSIEITFLSAVNYLTRKSAEQHLQSPGHTIAGGSYLRKEQCNFGWDWGPKCVTCGIWRPVQIFGYNKIRLQHVHFEQQHVEDGKAELIVELESDTVE